MVEREWGQLLYTNNGNIVDLGLFALLDEVIVHVAAAKDDALDGFRGNEIRRVVSYHSAEASLGTTGVIKLVYRRNGFRESE